MPTQAPPSASSHYAQSALLAAQAAKLVAPEVTRGDIAAALRILARYQAVAAYMAEVAVAEMLSEQEIRSTAEAALNPVAFTTPLETFQPIAEATAEKNVERMVASLVQDAGRVAESVSTAVRPRIHHVRFLSPPSCPRCAVLAGRVYRYSEGFLRHPNCDCTMIPTTVAATGLIEDPRDLLEQGLLVGLSKADRAAVLDGADLGQVVNVRRASAGLKESGRVLARRGRPTPEGIYRLASDRAEVMSLLARFGYVL